MLHVVSSILLELKHFRHGVEHEIYICTAALLSAKLMSCCAAGTNGCLDLRRRVSALDGQVSAEWSRCPGSMARRARDSVAPLRRSSAGWMPARSRRLSARCRTQASSQNTIRKASLMVGSMRRV